MRGEEEEEEACGPCVSETRPAHDLVAPNVLPALALVDAGAGDPHRPRRVPDRTPEGAPRDVLACTHQTWRPHSAVVAGRWRRAHVMYASWALTYSRLIMWLAISTIDDATADGIWPARICLNIGFRWRRHCWYLRVAWAERAGG